MEGLLGYWSYEVGVFFFARFMLYVDFTVQVFLVLAASQYRDGSMLYTYNINGKKSKTYIALDATLFSLILHHSNLKAVSVMYAICPPVTCTAYSGHCVSPPPRHFSRIKEETPSLEVLNSFPVILMCLRGAHCRILPAKSVERLMTITPIYMTTNL